MNKVLPIISLLFISFSSFSQKELNRLKKRADSICIKSNESLFCRSFDFYRNKQYDSCYVYSSKALLVTKEKEKKDILNYILTVSSIRKKMLKKALISISQVSVYKGLKSFRLGRIYLSLKEFDKAIQHFEDWLEISSDDEFKFKKIVFHNLGLCYLHKKKYDKAKYYFNKKVSLIQENDTASLIRSKMDLANVYYNQYLDDEAIPLFEEAYNLAKSFTNVELKEQTSQNMAVVERNRKRYKESVAYYREFIRWKDSLWNRDRIWELTEKDKKLAVAQKQQEIAIQEEQLKRQKVVQKGLLFELLAC